MIVNVIFGQQALKERHVMLWLVMKTDTPGIPSISLSKGNSV